MRGRWSGSAPASRHACSCFLLGGHGAQILIDFWPLETAQPRFSHARKPGDAGRGRVLEHDQQHVARRIAPKRRPRAEVALPSVAGAQLLDRGGDELALLGAALLALFVGETARGRGWPSGSPWVGVSPAPVRGCVPAPGTPARACDPRGWAASRRGVQRSLGRGAGGRARNRWRAGPRAPTRRRRSRRRRSTSSGPAVELGRQPVPGGADEADDPALVADEHHALKSVWQEGVSPPVALQDLGDLLVGAQDLALDDAQAAAW